MTTIAWDGKTLAADSVAVTNSVIHYVGKPKIRRAKGWLIGATGCHAHAGLMMDWFTRAVEDGFKEPAPPAPFGKEKVDGGSDAYLYAFSPGLILCFQGISAPIPLAAGLLGKGSGGEFAMGAMAAGRSAREAVEIASIYDVGTGGPIVTLDWEE